MTIKIGDRVRYGDPVEDELGTVAEPTAREQADKVLVGCVLVAWDDGERFWEDPTDLVVLEDA